MKIMGIINVTPDSFYKGSCFESKKNIKSKIDSLINHNINFIDVGAESSKPGSEPITSNEEIDRLQPIFKLINDYPQVDFSIDTYKTDVAEICLQNGFSIVNDIYAGRYDKKMFSIINKYNKKIILMHMKGNPLNMQKDTSYSNIIDNINCFFEKRIKSAIKAGINLKNIIIDPGIGFGKSLEDNFYILNNIKSFRKHGVPILIGPSRKSFLSLNNDEPNSRLSATIVCSTIAFQNGVDFIRVHDVKEIRQSISINQKILNYNILPT